MSRRCVLVFTRAPRNEARAKGLASSEPFFERLRARTLSAASSLPGAALVVAGDPGPFPLPPGSRVLSQRGRTFGERLENAFADARALGFREIVVVGTDSPGLGVRELARAFDALRRHHAVLGPAADGGVYLIGLRADAGILSGVRWRTGNVLAQLLARRPDAAVLEGCLADLDGRAGLRALTADRALDVDLAVLLRPRPPAALAPAPGPARPVFAGPSPLRGPPASPSASA